MNTAERYKEVLAWLKQQYPFAQTELEYGNPFQLLVAVVLSAQCTDKRVNLVTPVLFKSFPDPQAMANVTAEQIFPYIRSISYPNNKAKHLASLSKILIEKYNGEVPQTVDQLMELPGVGRKTANVITSCLFRQPNLAVDTHVFRVSARIGLTHRAKNPLQAEIQLVKHIPREDIPDAHHWLILHGRYVCTARSPKCDVCGITQWCKYYSAILKKKAAKKDTFVTNNSR